MKNNTQKTPSSQTHFKGLSKFDTSNHPLHVQYMFDQSATRTGFRILYLLSCSKSPIYGFRAIATMCDCSPSIAHREMKKLVELGYIIDTGGRYALPGGVHQSEQGPKSVHQSERKRSPERTEAFTRVNNTQYINNIKNTSKEYTPSHTGENNLITKKEIDLSAIDSAIHKYFADEWDSTDNRFSLQGKVPLSRYPDIWLKPTELAHIIDLLVKAGVESGNGLLELVSAKLATHDNPARVNCYTWLIGWAMREFLQTERSVLALAAQTARNLEMKR